MAKTLMICDCLGSQPIDAKALSDATGLPCSRKFTSLCAAQLGDAADAIGAGEVMIACQQEAPRFIALAEELGVPEPSFVDIRDRAGWSDEAASATAKMAALVAEAALPRAMPKSVDVVSEGTCLILGASDVAFEAAQQLADILAITVLMPSGAEIETAFGYDTVTGALRNASGTLGQFDIRIDALQQVIPGGRGAAQLTPPRDDALSQCDIILDLRGAGPLFSADDKRDGYLRADPRSQPAVAKAVLAASQLVGTFEKPLYVRTEPSLCAHSRAEQPACSRCLNLCPTGAITSAGDHVTIDPMICAGCGACAAVCPSGAIAYDAPTIDDTFRRISTLASTFRKAGGTAPRLLVHDEDHGADMIRLAARFGRGLPADVIPLEVSALAAFGHAEMLAALAAGFASVTVLISPKTEREAPDSEAALALALAGRDTAVTLIDATDPDQLSDALYAEATPKPVTTPALPMGTRRQVARLAAKTLQPEVETVALPEGAPYGAVLVDTDACTLCLSCVSLCPSGALGDNPDLPQLRFQEDACLQCGLCSNICPENAISLTPQMDLTDAAFTQTVLHEEEPFACIECGDLFGVKSTVEKITEKLAGKHAMFQNSQAARMIQMCDNCRINAQYHSENNPFAGGERPKPRTTDDYLSKRRDH
ncbi:4Fe-4S dicluster domain-containing protein [Litoreibacter ascidiaceicola]|uniref:4Fe-4S dicluster domain-containing protein n=1 Tax=Litoreibacter ascidiaceicola TaxID=1486859 RepID=A0A1M5DSA8_9RHOB|nr:4Fe-4S binding protein [Litoreibacter ascidiaceicola]SHF69877.1 4Fe-4S dicluster domain-containing protein [Litoreibacter ascidiaceicola]